MKLKVVCMVEKRSQPKAVILLGELIIIVKMWGFPVWYGVVWYGVWGMVSYGMGYGCLRLEETVRLRHLDLLKRCLPIDPPPTIYSGTAVSGSIINQQEYSTTSSNSDGNMTWAATDEMAMAMSMSTSAGTGNTTEECTKAGCMYVLATRTEWVILSVVDEQKCNK